MPKDKLQEMKKPNKSVYTISPKDLLINFRAQTSEVGSAISEKLMNFRNRL